MADTDDHKGDVAQADIINSIVGQLKPQGSNTCTSDCVICKQPTMRSRHAIVMLPGCNHVHHLDCAIKMLLIHNIKSCMECQKPEGRALLDLGDDILLQQQLDQQKRAQGMQQAYKLRMNCYSTSTVVEHAQGIAEVDRASASGFNDPLHCWIPNMDMTERVRELLLEKAEVFTLKRNNIDSVVILNSRVTLNFLGDAGYTIKEIHAMGFDWFGLIALGMRMNYFQNDKLFPIADMVRLFKITYVHILQLESSLKGMYDALYEFCHVRFSAKDLRDLQLHDIRLLAHYGLDKACMIGLSDRLEFQDFINLRLDGATMRSLQMLSEEDFESLGWPKDIQKVCRLLNVSTSEVKRKPPPAVPARQQQPQSQTQLHPQHSSIVLPPVLAQHYQPNEAALDEDEEEDNIPAQLGYRIKHPTQTLDLREYEVSPLAAMIARTVRR